MANDLIGARYLGDGVYATWDGWQIKLMSEQPEGPQRIYLDPDVQASLVRMFEDIAAGKVKPVDPEKYVIVSMEDDGGGR